MWWQCVIERPGRSKRGDWHRFVGIGEAVTRVETEMPRLRAEDEEFARKWELEKAEDLARIEALPTHDLKPYRVELSDLEPKRLTYRVRLEVECEPYDSQQEKISFGEIRHHRKRFYSPARLIRELDLNPLQVDIPQLDYDYGYYEIYSKVTYLQAPVAAAQAQ